MLCTLHLLLKLIKLLLETLEMILNGRKLTQTALNLINILYNVPKF